jgi:tetratricopeptide (TPR) repeat protein
MYAILRRNKALAWRTAPGKKSPELLCPDENELAAWAGGGAVDGLERLEAHVADCGDCRRLLLLLTPSEAEVADTRPVGESLPAQPAALAAGGRVGRFELVREIGRGGMGVVWEARDPTLERRVAVKLLPAGAVGDLARERLLREARSLARVSHPNVVAVHEAGIVGEQLFIAMELVSGEPLDRWIGSGRPWRAVAARFAAAARGLAAVHDAGLVHRDFKPHNVVVAGDQVKVIDFGLARLEGLSPAPALAADGEAAPEELTATGLFVGTPAYASPEQLAGEPAGPASDVFSFSVSLWQALMGDRPFKGRSKETLLAAIAVGPPPRPRRWPAPLRRLLLRGLAADPGDRPASMAAIAATLERSLGRRRRLVAAAVLAASAAAAAGWIAARPAAADPCAAAAELEAWTPLRRAAAAAALATSPSPVARGKAERLVAGLDRAAAGWSAARLGACRAGRIGEDPAAIAGSRSGCFERQQGRFASTVDLLTSRDRDAGHRAVELVAELPEPGECAADRVAGSPLPEDPARRAAIAEAGRELARIEALLAAGRIDEARGAIEPLVASAADHAPLLAGVHRARARAAKFLGELDAAIDSLKRAVWAATASRDPALEALAAAELALALVEHRSDTAGSADRIAHARALLPRLSPTEEAEVRLSIARALVVAHRFEDVEGELAAARRAHRRAGDDGAKRLWRQAALDSTAAFVATEKGDRLGALALQRRALASIEAAFGPDHPLVADTAEQLYRVARAAGKDDEERHQLRRAGAIRERLNGESNELFRLMFRAAANEGHPERQIPDLEAAHAVGRELYGDHHPDLAVVLVNLGTALAEAGRGDEGLQRIRQADALLVELYGAEAPERSMSLLGELDVRKIRNDHEEIARVARSLLPRLPEARRVERFTARLYLLDALAELGRWREARAEIDQLVADYEHLRPLLGDDPALFLELARVRIEVELGEGAAALARGAAVREEIASLELDDESKEELAEWDRWWATVSPAPR